MHQPFPFFHLSVIIFPKTFHSTSFQNLLTTISLLSSISFWTFLLCILHSSSFAELTLVRSFQAIFHNISSLFHSSCIALYFYISHPYIQPLILQPSIVLLCKVIQWQFRIKRIGQEYPNIFNGCTNDMNIITSDFC